MKYLVSVIIPVYNCEKLLSRAIDSVVNQDIFSDIEIILVDDGSIDDSGKICDIYAEKYNNIKVIHQVNSGVSVARNEGMKFAEGEWLFFLDSDDYLLVNAFSSINDYTDADIICCKHQSNAPLEENFDAFFSDGLYLKDEITDRLNHILVHRKIFYPCWGRIYKASVCKQHSVEFPANIKIAEDMVFVYSFLKYCKKIAFCSKDVYYYYVNQDNTSSVIPKSFDIFHYIFNWQKNYFDFDTDLVRKIESVFAYRSYMSLKTSATYMSFKEAIIYISSIVLNDDFIRCYLQENYQEFSCTTDKLLDRYVRKRNPYFIFFIIYFCRVKSELIKLISGDNRD